jgi:hypothetical protein
VKNIIIILLFLPSLVIAQVTLDKALDLAKSRANKIGYEVVSYKISNLNETNKKLFWFMSVGTRGGACLISIPETKLEIDYSKCVGAYEVNALTEAYGEIPQYRDVIQELLNREIELEKFKKKQLEQERYKNLMSNAELNVQQKKYTLALDLFNQALSVMPNDAVALSKLKDLENLMSFLIERKTKIYELSEVNKILYNQTDEFLLSNLLKISKETNSNMNLELSLSIICDTNGIVKHELKSSSDYPTFIDEFEKVVVSLKLPNQLLNNYSVNFKSNYNFKIKHQTFVFTMQKSNLKVDLISNNNGVSYSEAINNLPQGPIGTYTIELKKRSINGVDYSSSNLLKFEGMGGSSNAFLSLIVPGLGDKAVSGGIAPILNKRTFITYSLILTGALCKSYSNQQYAKYLIETDPLRYEEYYKNANLSNQAFYTFLSAGVAYWLYDIWWVYNRGSKNQKEQLEFKNRNRIEFAPSRNSIGFNLSINLY